MNEREWIPTSMRETIANLPVGDSYARAIRLRPSKIRKGTVPELVTPMRNTLNAAMRRAMVETGNKYTIDTGNFLTQSGNVIIVAAVTRTE